MAKINGETAGLLETFRSYSYYHVLAICEDTDTASALAYNGSAEEIWQHPTVIDPNSIDSGCIGSTGKPIDSSNFSYTEAKYMPKQIGNGKYVVLINGSTDAQFSIDKFAFTTLSGTTSTSDPKFEASMTVTEPLGVSFIDYLIRAQHYLGISSMSAIYVVKTFFVGYQHTPGTDQNDTVQVISDIDACILSLTDITGNITEAGSIFEITFVGTGDTAGVRSQYSTMPSTVPVIPIDTTNPITVSATLSLLENKLNAMADKQYNCIKHDTMRAVNASNPGSPISEEDAKKLVSRVRYRINNQAYSNPVYKVNETGDPNTTTIGTTTGAPNIIITAGTNMEYAIRDQILMRSDMIRQEATSVGPRGKMVPQVTTSFSIKKVGECQKEFWIDYTITSAVDTQSGITPDGKPIVKPSVDSTTNEELINSYNQDIGASDPVTALDLITFDYLYTGGNIDIINMDLKIANGHNYLLSGKLVQPWKPSASLSQGATTVTPNRAAQLNHNNANTSSTPATSPELKNSDYQNAASHLNTLFNMNLNAAVESLSISITIRGNDALLFSTRVTNPDSIINPVPRSESSNREAFRNFNRDPKLAKINMRFPPTSDTTALVQSGEYGAPFWHQGLYKILSISHNFVDGEFTQELNLMSLFTSDQNSALLQSNEDGDKTAVDGLISSDADLDSPCAQSQSACAETVNTGTQTVPTTLDLSSVNVQKVFKQSNIDPNIQVLDTAAKYYTMSKGPDPKDPSKTINYNPPMWISEERYNTIVGSDKPTYVSTGRGAVSKVEDTKKTVKYDIKPIPPEKVQSAINTAWRTLDDNTRVIKMQDHVGNKIPCGVVAEKMSNNQHNTKFVNGKYIFTNTGKNEIANVIPQNSTAQAIPDVVAAATANYNPSSPNYDKHIFSCYADSEEYNKSCSVDDITNYRTIPANVKSEMIRASNDMSVSPDLFKVIVLIGNAESSFRPSISANTSSATGLFQFTGDTWKGLVSANKIPGVSSGDSNVLDARKDPYICTIGMIKFTHDNAAYMKKFLARKGISVDKFDPAELYLAHHFGAFGGSAIVRAHKQGLDNVLVTDERVWGSTLNTAQIQQIYKSNPQLAKRNVYTVADFYVYSSTQLVKGIDTKNMVARSQQPTISGAT